MLFSAKWIHNRGFVKYDFAMWNASRCGWIYFIKRGRGSAPRPFSMGRCPKPHLSPFWKKVLKIPKTFDKRKTAFFSGICKVLDKWNFCLKPIFSKRLYSFAKPLISPVKRKCTSARISYSLAKQKCTFSKIYNPPPKTAFSAYPSFPLSFQERGGGGAAPRVPFLWGVAPNPI